MALTIVGTQSFTYLRYLSRTTNSIGVDVPTYESAITLTGQIQAAPKELFELYGLEFNKNLLVFYVSKDIIDVTRNSAGDQIQFAGKTFNVLSDTPWFDINGWDGVVAVEI